MNNLFISFILTFIIMLTIFWLTSVQVQIHSLRKGKNDKLRVRVTAWFEWIRIETEIPIVKLTEHLSGASYTMEMKSPNKTLEKSKGNVSPADIFQVMQRTQLWINKIYGVHIIAKKFLKHVRFNKLEWKSTIGTGDAAETGLLTGLVWGIKASIMGFFMSYVTLRTVPRIHVQPFYHDKKLESEFLCMFCFRIGNAILAGIRMIINLRKRRDVKWQSTQFRA